MYYIYALIDPINNTPFYIGKGKNNRAWSHLRPGKSDLMNGKKNSTINNIRMLGFEPLVVMLHENIDDEDYAYRLESAMIKLAYLFSFNLTNRIGIDLRPPSRKGVKDSAETKLKKSIASRNRVLGPLSVEHKEKIGKAHRGRSKPERTDEHKRNIGLSKSKLFDITFPDGHIERVLNMRRFCLEHNLSQGHLHTTTTGKRTHHKGFSAKSVTS